VLLTFGVLLYLFLRGGWRESQAPAAGSLRQAEQRLISVSGESHRAATFSPDGTMIAFVRAVHGIRQIWVKNLAGGDPIQITFGQLATDRPRWSPRNDQIVFTLGSLGRDGASPEWRIESIWCVPPLGGAPRKIIESGGKSQLVRRRQPTGV
jgi:dipeptidyl aminopeptidase/acylaminoacyl peptidase